MTRPKGWKGEPKRHSEAAKKGWRRRRRNQGPTWEDVGGEAPLPPEKPQFTWEETISRDGLTYHLFGAYERLEDAVAAQKRARQFGVVQLAHAPWPRDAFASMKGKYAIYVYPD